MIPESKTLEFHLGTQHPNGALLDYRHRYYAGMRPALHKAYKDRPSVPLSVGEAADDRSALDVIGGFSEVGKAPDFGALSRLLHYSAGITRTIRGYPFRAAACTGALYHIELYVVCRTIGGLDAGVYHYDPIRSRLVRLREGDWRIYLSEAAARNDTVRRSPATIVYTDVYWRNAIKYQARAYRHSFWDAGTILANTLALANSMDLRATLHMAFADPLLAELLGVDPAEELPLALVSLEVEGDWAEATGLTLDRSRIEAEPATEGRARFPEIPAIHQASSFADTESARLWMRASGPQLVPEGEPSEIVDLRPPARSGLPRALLTRVIRRRGSSRAFTGEPISRAQLAALLDRSIRPIRADYWRAAPLIQPHAIVNAVEGLASGVYRVRIANPGEQLRLEAIRLGGFRTQATHLALDQDLGGDAAVNLYFMADLAGVIRAYGERGYRLAQIEAAIMAGWGYLAAYALGIGATGLTFYDAAVERFLGVAEHGLKVMFLLAVGVPRTRGR